MAWGHGYITSSGLGTVEVGETAETGGPPEDDEEAVVLTTLPVLRISCDSRVEVLLLCGVAVAREKAKGGDPVDDMLPSRAGWRIEAVVEFHPLLAYFGSSVAFSAATSIATIGNWALHFLRHAIPTPFLPFPIHDLQ
jgi:hypothetical protein